MVPGKPPVVSRPYDGGGGRDADRGEAGEVRAVRKKPLPGEGRGEVTLITRLVGYRGVIVTAALP